ncbi:MAG: thioredoxin domain-containing protein [Gemmatimonadota bacterium]
MAGQKSFNVVLGVVAVAGLAWLAMRTLGAPDLPVRAAQGTPDTTGFTGYVIGSADAPVEITEYADLQCPQCASFDQVQWPDIKTRLIDTGKLRFRYRDFPLDNIHPETRIAMHAAACANDQDRFWQMKDRIYAGQNDWAFKGTGAAYDVMRTIATSVGLNADAFQTCMTGGTHAARIEASLAESVRLGVGQTPTFLIEGRLYPGLIGSDQMAHIVDSLTAMKGAPTQ